jgi:hypothetical protein
MRTLRTNFSRLESRRDRRYAIPPLVVSIDGHDYISDNWSLGGFHLTGELAHAVDEVVTGTFKVDSDKGPKVFDFSAKVVRHEEVGGKIAFHFEGLSGDAVTALDRALARRLGPRRR